MSNVAAIDSDMDPPVKRTHDDAAQPDHDHHSEMDDARPKRALVQTELSAYVGESAGAGMNTLMFFVIQFPPVLCNGPLTNQHCTDSQPMVTASTCSIEDDPEVCCPVCTEPYNFFDRKPMLVPGCHHSVCETCAHLTLDGRCPVDLRKLSDEQAQVAIFEVNSALINALIQRGVLPSSCGQCKVKEATLSCIDCKDVVKYCSDCWKEAHAAESKRIHKTTEIEHFSFDDIVKSNTCSIHPRRPLVYLCQEHTALFCADCYHHSPHKSHDVIDLLEQKGPVRDHSNALNESLLASIEMADQALLYVTEDLHFASQQIHTACDTQIAQIEEERARLLDSLGKQCTAKMTSIHSMKRDLQMQVDWLHRQQGELIASLHDNEHEETQSRAIFALRQVTKAIQERTSQVPIEKFDAFRLSSINPTASSLIPIGEVDEKPHSFVGEIVHAGVSLTHCRLSSNLPITAHAQVETTFEVNACEPMLGFGKLIGAFASDHNDKSQDVIQTSNGKMVPLSDYYKREPVRIGDSLFAVSVAHRPDVRVRHTKNNGYTSTYGLIFPEEGEYTVHVLFRHWHINGSPFHVKVVSSEPSLCICDVETKQVCAGIRTEVHIKPYDRNGKRVWVKGDDFSVCAPLDPHFKPGKPWWVSPSDGYYFPLFSKRLGDLSLEVKLRGQHIQGSPFLIHVSKIDLSSVRAFGSGLSACCPGKTSSFFIDARHMAAKHEGLKAYLIGDPETQVTFNDRGKNRFIGSYLLHRQSDVRLAVTFDGEHIPGSPFPKLVFDLTFTNGPSTILSDSLVSTLMLMLPSNRHSLNLLHSSSNGITPAQFWEAVEGKSRILVLVRNTAGYIFGGYVENDFDFEGVPDFAPWVQGHDYNFVFSLGNKTGKPVKLLKNVDAYPGIIFDSKFGLLMGHCGQVNGGLDALIGQTSDLRVGNGYCCSPKSYTTRAPGYSGVTIDSTLLAGSETWTPDLIEIFQCS
jgi:hypothetical protein